MINNLKSMSGFIRATRSIDNRSTHTLQIETSIGNKVNIMESHISAHKTGVVAGLFMTGILFIALSPLLNF